MSYICYENLEAVDGVERARVIRVAASEKRGYAMTNCDESRSAV